MECLAQRNKIKLITILFSLEDSIQFSSISSIKAASVSPANSYFSTFSLCRSNMVVMVLMLRSKLLGRPCRRRRSWFVRLRGLLSRFWLRVRRFLRASGLSHIPFPVMYFYTGKCFRGMGRTTVRYESM